MTLRLVRVSVGGSDPAKCGECPLLGKSRSPEDIPVEFCLAENWKLGGKLRIIENNHRHELCLNPGGRP